MGSFGQELDIAEITNAGTLVTTCCLSEKYFNGEGWGDEDTNNSVLPHKTFVT